MQLISSLHFTENIHFISRGFTYTPRILSPYLEQDPWLLLLHYFAESTYSCWRSLPLLNSSSHLSSSLSCSGHLPLWRFPLLHNSIWIQHAMSPLFLKMPALQIKLNRQHTWEATKIYKASGTTSALGPWCLMILLPRRLSSDISVDFSSASVSLYEAFWFRIS